MNRPPSAPSVPAAPAPTDGRPLDASSPRTAADTPSDDDVRALLATIDARVPFGPGFFMRQLRAFVRDRCPDPREALPIVELTLESGEICDVCHVIGVAPHWVALAAREPRTGEERAMRTELVPYATIRRVTIRPGPTGIRDIGFDRDHRTVVVRDHLRSPEAILERAAGTGASDVDQ